MIKKVEISNFRNVKSDVIELDRISIIAGKNNIGKSNRLNAINWSVSNCLLTDKWGSGENDTNSIIKIGAEKGEDPKVSLTLDDGKVFTKTWKSVFDKHGNLKSHKAEYMINNTAYDTENQYKNELYNAFNFKKFFLWMNDTSEIRLFVDPLYALQKQDEKELRKQLIELGCDIPNETIYKLGEFEILKPIEAKYDGDFSKAEKDLKKQLKEQDGKVIEYETLVKQYAGIEAYNAEKHIELKNKVTELYRQVATIAASDNNEALNGYKIELEKAKAEYSNAKHLANKEWSDKMSDLKVRLMLAQANRGNKKEKATAGLMGDYKLAKEQLNQLNEKIATLTESRKNMTLELNSMVENGKEKQQRKANLAVKLADWNSKQFNNYVKCPNCGSLVVVDEDALRNFNVEKQNQVTSIKNDIEYINTELKTLHDKCVNYQQQIKNANADIDALNLKNIELKNQVLDMGNKINELLTLADDPTEENNINAAINDLKLHENEDNEECKLLKIKVENLETKIVECESNSDAYVSTEIASINNEILALSSQVDELTILQSKHETKAEYEAKLSEYQKAYNDLEFLLGKVKSFTNKQVELINNKAKEITGIDFVMLEKNVTNDDLNKVCYATVDGVPFKDVNTAKKIEVGIRFIENIKSILSDKVGVNTFPILADRMEGIDFEDKIKSITKKEQFICTRVTQDEQITII